VTLGAKNTSINLGFLAKIKLSLMLWVMVAMFTLNIVWLPYAHAVMVELNSNGGNTATDGLHFYIDDSTQLQVRRLDNTGQVYSPSSVPPDVNLDNGIYLRANGRIFGPSNFAYTPNGGAFTSRTITATTPPNPAAIGDQQTTTHDFGVTSGPQVDVVWKYTKPFDFITAEVTLTIPLTYPVSLTNPVRYYHVVDTYLGGSDNGCGVRYTDSNGKLVVGTYPPPSGTTCPSSTAVPSGVSVVESFRERSGTFSNYCAGAWDRFWTTGGVNCAVSQSANMSNTISTTYQDTGVGIQYNFIAPGTYTFSYDFVVGSTLVPAYDHFEIRHPGAANLCPVDVTVLACTSSTVPCPAANIVNTGTLTGSIRQTPGAPAIAQTPSTFTLGATASTATVKFQGSGAGTFNLTGQSLSSTPLNGTRCWNTTTNTASCSFTVTNVPCVTGFECVETGLSYNNLTTNPASRNPLYTQVSGNGFRFDVVALQSGGAQSTGYTASSGVTVELFNDSASPQPACSAYSSPIASQAITFSAGDNGRKTLPSNFVLNNAYTKVRCRVRDTNVSVSGCSSDIFSVRPSSFTLSATANADATGASVTNTPAIKAGSAFGLTATSGVVGYNGVPQIDNTKIQAHTTAVQAGAVSGSFTAANAANGTATGANFNYSEVGYFRFAANGVYDSLFTAVDSATGDCATGFSAVGSKQACSFGNASNSNYFGRFIPDHFALTQSTTTQGCAGGFTYLGFDGFTTNFNLIAQNASNSTTQNYSGSFVKLGNLWSNFNFTATGVPATSSLLASATAPSAAWASGVGAITAKHQITRPTAKVAPASVAVFTRPVDLDGVTMASTQVSPASEFRLGRLYLPNSYGSELLPLNASIEAQYWNGSAYVRNQLDTCTVVPANTVAMGNYKKSLNACETQLTGSGSMLNGLANFRLSRPGAGNGGSVDLSVNLNAAAGSVCNTATATSAGSANMPWFGSTNPGARATFGIFKTPVIYMRENF
jgi:MSHA biogenesis protein MshQ